MKFELNALITVAVGVILVRRAFLIGHFSLDKIELNKKVHFPVLGGAVAYAGVILRKLGYDVIVVSEIGTDFPKTYLDFFESIGIKTEFISQTSRHTTSYYLRYKEDGSRELFLLKRARSISLQFINKLNSLITSDDLILLLPITNEIPGEYFEFLEKGKSSILTLDIQGLLRVPREGFVKLQKPERRILSAIRKISLDIIKISYEEAHIFAQNARLLDLISEIRSELNVENVILSLGERGTVGFYKGKLIRVPIIKNIKPKNPTGAGDILISSFAALFAKGLMFENALKIANEIAGYSVRYMDPLEIYKNIKL